MFHPTTGLLPASHLARRSPSWPVTGGVMRQVMVWLTLIAFGLFALPAAAQTWSAPVDLSVAGQRAEAPQVTSDSAGVATAVWYRYNGTNYVVQASRFSGSTWSAPVNLSVSGQNAFTPQVTVDSAGVATAAWYRFNGTDYIIQASRFSGSSWSAPVDLSVSGQNASNPQVTVDSAGVATAVWVRFNGTSNIVQASRFSGSAWSAPVDLSVSGQNAYDPQVTVDSTGIATAVWYRSNGTNNIVQASRFSGTAWSAPVNLSVAGRDAYEPQVTVDSTGIATAVWYRFNGTNLIIQASRFSGSAWSAPVDLSVSGRDANEPQVTVDNAGIATAVWQRFNGTNVNIQASRFSGSTWSAPVDLSIPGQAAYYPQVTMNSAGVATAVWQHSNQTNYIIQASRFSGTAWSAPVDLSVAGQNAEFPQVTVDSAGVATAVWQGGSIIQGSRFAFSTDATLSALSLSTGTLSPAFASGTTGYTATVSNAVTSITVTPTLSSAVASVAVNGTPVVSGSPSDPIPLNVGGNTVTVVVTAEDGTTTATYTIDVSRLLPAPVADSFTALAVAYNPGGASATVFSVAGNVTHSPTSYSVGSTTTAQGGSVSINNTGLASYTPPVGFRGDDSFTYTASNTGGTSSPATVTVPVSDPALVTSLIGSGVRDAALSGVSIIVTGGAAPYACAPTPVTGVLPPGVALNADCTITGVPTASGTFTFTTNVSDSSTGTGPLTQSTTALTLSVAAPTLTLSPASGTLPGATVGAAYAQTFSGGGGNAPYDYSVPGPGLPTGISLSGDTLSGTPTSVGTFNFTVVATDSSSPGSGGPYTVSNAYSITVAQGTPILTFGPLADLSLTSPPPSLSASSPSPVAITFSSQSPFVCTVSGTGVTLVSAGTCTIAADQVGNTDWAAASQQTQSFVVGQGVQTITFTSTAPAAATIGGSTYMPTATSTSGLSVVLLIDAGSSGVCSRSGGVVSFTGAGTCVINANQAGDPNYSPASQVQQSFAVGRQSQSISFSTTPAASPSVGDSYIVAATADSGLTAALTIEPSSAGVCSISGNVVSLTGAGVCIINANQAGDATYDPAAQAQQSFTVGQGVQTITFTSVVPTPAFVGGGYTASATASSGLPVALSASGACSIAGSSVSFTSPGLCTVTATQAGNTDYAPAVPVEQTFTVSAPASQTITFTSPPPAGAAIGDTYSPAATAGSGLPVTFTIDPASSGVCTLSGGVVSFIGNGTCTIHADQAGNDGNSPAPRVTVSILVAAPTAVPTLSEWAMMVFGTLLAGGGALYIRRRRFAAA